MLIKTNSLYLHTGRVLLGLYFLVPGLAKLLAPASQLEMMQHHNIMFAEPLLWISGIVQTLGALALLANRYVRFSALGFVVYILIINMLLHDFWNFAGIEAAHEVQSFIKNLGILAGLFVLAANSPVRGFKFANLLRSDHSQ